METLIIRVDASTEIGIGHFMRCLALAQAWKDAGGQVAFITACQNEGLLERLRGEEFDLHGVTHPHPSPRDWDYTSNILSAYPNAWVVLDGQHGFAEIISGELIGEVNKVKLFFPEAKGVIDLLSPPVNIEKIATINEKLKALDENSQGYE